jgi:hypothetical protein
MVNNKYLDNTKLLLILSITLPFVTSCEKVKDVLRISKSNYVLDSLVVNFEYTGGSFSCANLKIKEHYKYNEEGICDTVIRYTYRVLCSLPLSIDSTIYSKSGNDVYRKYGSKGTFQNIGKLSPDGYLIQNTNSYSEITTIRNYLGGPYYDTSGSGFLSYSFNNYWKLVDYQTKNYNVSHQSAASYPVSKSSQIFNSTIKNIYNNWNLTQSQVTSISTTITYRKSSATAPWVFFSYGSRTLPLSNNTLPDNNLYIKRITNNTPSSFTLSYPNYFWKNNPENIISDFEEIYSYSTNSGATYNTYATYKQKRTDSHVNENNLIKSYNYFNYSYQSNTYQMSSKEDRNYFYHKTK